MSKNKIKYENAITLIALVVTIIVLLILAGVSIMMLTGDNGILTNAQQTSTQSAYKGAEEQVKIAYMAVKTEIMAKTVEDGTYDPTESEETIRLAGIVEKDLGITSGNTNGTWSVDSSEAGKIKITYTDSKIDQGVIGTVNLTQLDEQVSPTVVPRYEGVVHYQINLIKDTQDAKLFLDVATSGGSGGGSGGGGLSFAGLSAEDGDATLPTEVKEVAYADVTNKNLQNTSKIKAVIKGSTTATGTGEVPIPVDAIYKEGTESTGVVIEYKGSEFVWVPVPVAIKDNTNPSGAKPMAKVATVTGYASTTDEPNYEGVLYEFSVSATSVSSKEMSTYGQHEKTKSQYREPDRVTSYDSTSQNYLKDIGFVKNNQSDPDAFLGTLISDYKEMVKSVDKYGGFYVGRYETSIDSETVVASKKSTETTTIMPMTEADNSQMWYGMYDKQRKFSGINPETREPNGDNLVSSMIWGSQYDAMLNWMLTGNEKAKINERNNGNHNTLGAVGCGTYNAGGVYDIINNIYDLEGNVTEGTLEAITADRRVLRSGNYNAKNAVSSRSGGYPYYTIASYGSRLSLYIK